ncbi:MAG TPA: ferritin-like domain-containing protein [Flavobacterium sp.]|jgi:hypothetical protein|nr:ferritin-like domain-containing protein [Flavobacterium sp.]
MSIIKFIESFTDESLLQSTVSRRNSLSHFTNIGKKGALAAIPGGLLTLLLAPQKGSATTLSPLDDSTPIQALQLALTLEYLDSEFYQMGLDTNNLIPTGRDRDVFSKIVQNENAHKATLIAALGGEGSANFIPPPTFDYTANGLFDPFNNYDQFLALAQAFEDTGVRAYKGQAHNLMSNPDLLQTALQIHSAESRQASEVRRLRGEKGWITGNQRGTGVDAAMQPVYNGEELTMQRGFNTATVNNGTMGPAISSNAGSESFDEPLTRSQVMAIANMFIEP